MEDHYVEDPDGTFRVTYTPEKFIWSIDAPKSNPEYHVLVKNSKTQKIMGMILG